MKRSLLCAVLIATITLISCAQNTTQQQKTTSGPAMHVGGGCEGCSAIYEQAPSFDQLKAADTLPDFNEQGQKIQISGIIYKADAKTPAPGVVLYVYHTDQTGHYTPKAGQTGYARRHGYIRGWVKTNEKGEYNFYTLKPIAYPGEKIPAHIHAIIKEPDVNEYWIDEYLFEGDPYLTEAERKKQENRAGRGIIELREEKGIMSARRNIILGQNVPGYKTL